MLIPYAPIEDHGLIGDMNSCALVSRDGVIDWACFPRFDSPSCFAAILDDVKGGRFSVQPVGAPTGPFTTSQRYLPDTTVLETTFETGPAAGGGVVVVLDFMPHARPRTPESPHQIVRIVRGLRGSVDMRLLFQPRLDYARGETLLSPTHSGVLARNGDRTMALVTGVPVAIERAPDGGQQAVGSFTVREGDVYHVVAAYGVRRAPSVRAMDCEAKLRRAVRHDHSTVSKLSYEGGWRELVVRSFLTLHLLMYEPTGAIVAAPTTSLPEAIGGPRNWDYRFSWLRDGAWTSGILFRLGDPHEGIAFVDWIVGQCWLAIDSMQILYGISPDSTLAEETLDHLEGYRGSGPVRIGNDAAYHRQLDVFGEVAMSLGAYERYYGSLTENAWSLLRRSADLACDLWRLPDRGIWEVRGPEQHFVYSKIMCWVALDRAIHIAQSRSGDSPVDLWRAEAAKLHADILANGWSEAKQSFVQAYGSEAVDASALLIPFVGFLPEGDPRVRSTIKRVQQELASGPFVHRYRTDETDDGLAGDEGAFYMLSFWLIGALLSIGDTDEALARFEDVVSTANHLGLFAEMIDPSSRTALGNFPQAFSHIGLIHTARNLSLRGVAREPGQELIG